MLQSCGILMATSQALQPRAVAYSGSSGSLYEHDFFSQPAHPLRVCLLMSLHQVSVRDKWRWGRGEWERGVRVESGYQLDELAELCRMWAPQGASPVQTHGWGTHCSSWSKAVPEANLLSLFSDAPCLPSPLPVPSIYVST